VSGVTSVTDRFENLNAAERKANRILTAALDGPQRLAYSTHLLIGEVAVRIRQREGNQKRYAARVCIQLLHRASNDLRCASQVMFHGYPAQGATICASLYEAVLAAAYIGADEDLAREWLQHDDEKNKFRPVIELAAIIGKGDEGITAKVYSVYRSLCMPKHVNPVTEVLMGVELIEGVPFLRNGPDTSEFAIFISWRALVDSCRTVLFALDRVAKALLDATDIEALQAPLMSAAEHCHRLSVEFIARWGGEDKA